MTETQIPRTHCAAEPGEELHTEGLQRPMQRCAEAAPGLLKCFLTSHADTTYHTYKGPTDFRLCRKAPFGAGARLHRLSALQVRNLALLLKLATPQKCEQLQLCSSYEGFGNSLLICTKLPNLKHKCLQVLVKTCCNFVSTQTSTP